MLEIPKQEKVGSIIKLLSEGNKQQDIANLVGISRASVAKIMKESNLTFKDIKKIKTMNKLKESNISISDIKTWWDDENTIKHILNKIISMGCNEITSENIRYILKDILKIKNACKICNKEIDIGWSYCSDKCVKEAAKDHSRTTQHNRRVQGGGKIAQRVVCRAKLIKEANGLCYLCGEKLDITIKDVYHPLYIVLDHVKAVIKSHDSSKDNLKPTCRCCNEIKGKRPEDYFTMDEYKNNKKLRLANYVPKIANYELISTEEFIIDCNNGMTYKELSSKYNKSENCIYLTKKNLNLTNKKHKNNVRLDKEYALGEVTKLTKEGKTIIEISEILNISKCTVGNYRKLGGCIKNVAKVEEITKVDKIQEVAKIAKIEEVARLYNEGKSIYEITKILNLIKVRVCKYLEPVIEKKILEVHNSILRGKAMDSIEHDRQISIHAKVSMKTVYKYRKKFNW